MAKGKFKSPKLSKPDPALLARSIDDLLAEHDQVMKSIRSLLDRSRELSHALDYMKRKEFRHKWTAPEQDG